MMANTAWMRHGCYALGSDQYYNFNLKKPVLGCRDDWNSLDHFDPTSETRRMIRRMLQLRTAYPVLQDGFGLDQYRNWTHEIQRPGSNGSATEMGLWSVARSAINTQSLGNVSEQVWMLYTNENQTQSYTWNCKKETAMTPFASGTTVQNLFAPYETYTLEASTSSAGSGFYGCITSLTMEPFGFKALVATTNFVAPLPALTKFKPGHDARLPDNSSSIDIVLEFNTQMDCDSVTAALSLNMSSSGHGSPPSVPKGTCTTVSNPDAASIAGGDTSQYSWSGTITNVPDGILTLILDNPKSSKGVTTGVRLPVCSF